MPDAPWLFVFPLEHQPSCEVGVDQSRGEVVDSDRPQTDGSSEVQMLSVAVPFHNEVRTLRASVERLLKAELPVPVEVLLVDDGSTDNSVSAVEDLLAEPTIRLLRHSDNLGKGAAVRTAMAVAKGRLLTVMDGDLEYEPQDYGALLSPVLENDAVVVFGTRSFGAQSAYSFWYVIGNRFLSLWASFLFNAWLSDVETCFKLAPTRVWRELNLRSRGFGIEAELTGKLLKAGYRIHEVPIRYRARGRSAGKKLRARDGIKALLILLRIRLFP